MRVNFRERFRLPLREVFSYFATPADWTRLYGAMGEVRDLGEGWYAVPLKRFPFPLVAKITELDADRRVKWVFRGFWRGEGDVRFEETDDGVVVQGFEEIAVRWLGPLSIVVEKLLLERRFRAIWSYGWRRLRREEASVEPSRESERRAVTAASS